MGRPTTKRDEAGRQLVAAAFGPAIPFIPVKDFSRMPHEVIAGAWSIVGPSAMRNLNAGVPLWEIIACAYAEGLNHGSEIERSRNPLNMYKEIPIDRKRKK